MKKLTKNQRIKILKEAIKCNYIVEYTNDNGCNNFYIATNSPKKFINDGYEIHYNKKTKYTDFVTYGKKDFIEAHCWDVLDEDYDIEEFNNMLNWLECFGTY